MTPAQYLQSHRDDIVGLLQKLVRIPTVNPPGDKYAVFTALLAKEMRAAGLKVRRLPVPSALQRRHQPDQMAYPRFNLLGYLHAGARRTVHLNAHYDVVPVSGEWKHRDPFSGTVDGGWVHGRGSADMKGAITAIVFALRALRATSTRPRCNVEVSFTADEETDSLLGAGWLVDKVPLKADYAIVGEGGSGDGVCCGHNGVVWLEVSVHGKPAHGSTPHRGVNALEKMSALVTALQDYKRRIARRTFHAPDGSTMRPTLNIGGVFAAGPGGKINTVPAFASFTIDRRVLPVERVPDAEKDLRAFLKSAAARIPQCRISIRKVSENHSCYSAPTAPFFRALQSSVSKVRGRAAHPMVSSGFNDMHFFAHALDIPTIGYGPGGVDYHAVDERARIRDLVNAAQVYADLLTTFAG
jgi:succinyl-diaminopimelate desuccinylase